MAIAVQLPQRLLAVRVRQLQSAPRQVARCTALQTSACTIQPAVPQPEPQRAATSPTGRVRPGPPSSSHTAPRYRLANPSIEFKSQDYRVG